MSSGEPVRAFAGEPQPHLRLSDLAFFLDVDGTIVEIAPTPDDVVVDDELIEMLRTLAVRTQGALAFVSGRSIPILDMLFHPLVLPAAGLHGFERRNATGTYCRGPLPPGELLARARARLPTRVSLSYYQRASRGSTGI